MENIKEVVYIPFWIAGMLERNNLPLSEVLDYRKMSQFLSAQEQANMLLFQNFSPFADKVKDGRRLPNFDSGFNFSTDVTQNEGYDALGDAWRKCLVSSTDANDSRLLENFQSMSSFAYNPITENEINMRFDPDNCGAIAHSEPFITYDVEREFCIVVVYPLDRKSVV